MSSEELTDRLIWVDLEMTGLDPLTHRVLEIATLVTAGSLEVVAEGPDLVIHQPEGVLAGMNDWSRAHHTASGLLDRVRESTLDEAAAEALTLEFLGRHCPAGQAPLAGNSVHMDRLFLSRYMPELEKFFKYVRKSYPLHVKQVELENELEKERADRQNAEWQLTYVQALQGQSTTLPKPRGK